MKTRIAYRRRFTVEFYQVGDEDAIAERAV